MKKFVASKRILVFITLILFVIVTVSIALVVSAESLSSKESSSSVSSETSETGAGSTASPDVSSNSTSSLSSEDIDKILESVKVEGDLDSLIKQMDDIINRAMLTNNTDLKQYAEYVKQACELQKQLNTVNASISTLKQKNSSIASIDEGVQKNMNSDISLDNVNGVLSADGMELLKDLDMSKITDGLNDIPGMETVLNDPTSATESQKDLAETALLQSALDQDLLEGEKAEAAKACINTSLSVLVANEAAKYSSSEYDSLVASSKEFELQGNKCESLAPSQVILYGESVKLTLAPIIYDKNILISIDDVIRFTGASVQYTDGTANIALSKDKKLVEITKGSNVAYVNDSNVNTIVPVLTVKGVTYIPVEFFAQAFDISYVSVPDNGVFIMYSNSVQTK